MGDEQGTLFTMTSDEAVDAEIGRLVRRAENLAKYRNRALRAYGYKIIRDAVPSMTRDRWRELAGQEPDVSQDSDAVRERTRMREADLELLAAHGQARCCAECDHVNAERIRAQQGLPAPVVEEEEAPERTCECYGCGNSVCQGDCEPCSNHTCEQCWPEGCPEDDLSDCCGICLECDRHPNGANGNDVCDQGYCHECDHHCD